MSTERYTREEQEFLTEIDRAVGWEWRYEKRHRYWMLGLKWAAWTTRLLLLAGTSLQLSLWGGRMSPIGFVWFLASLGLLNVTIPLLEKEMRFQQRQEVHDWQARAMTEIRLQFTTRLIPLSEAVRRLGEIYSKPTEKVIRQTL